VNTILLSQAASRPFCRAGWTLAALMVLGAAVVPCRLMAEGSPANVVVITIDTVRADHLGCYGDCSIATPNVDGLAHSAARFTHAFTPVPITLPAHTALFTGTFPMATGVHDFSDRVPASAVTLAQVLLDHGYSTAAFLGADVLDSRFGLNRGFKTYFDHFDRSRPESGLDMVKRTGDQVVDYALDWLETNPRRPLFLWVHLYDAHTPYAPPEPYASRYRGRPYDGEIAFVDAQVGRLIAFLNDVGVYEHAVVVVAGDHGEGLGEHGEKAHGFFVYNSTLHVPLLVKVPGTGARTIEKEASLVDVMPTVLQALQLAIPPSVQGRSLLSDILGKASPSASNLYAESNVPLLHFQWSPLHALQSDGLKYIDAPRPELYDTRIDPHETKNLLPAKQALAHEMRDRLHALEHRYTLASGTEAKKSEPKDPELEQRLRSLGYVAVSGGTFSDSSGKVLPDPKDRIRVYELVSEAMAEALRQRYRESLEKLREAEKEDPVSLAIRYLQGIDYYQLRDSPLALERFKAARELDPKYSPAIYYLGLTEVQAGDLKDAEASFQRTLELNPHHFAAAYDLGMLEVKQNRIQEGLRHLEQATEINPQYAAAFEAIGELDLYLHRNEDAVHALERVVASTPNFGKAHYNLGRAYQALGRLADAQKEFARARSLGAPDPTR